MSDRKHLHLPRHAGDRVADSVTSAMGSWKFIIIQSIVVSVWIVFNLIAVIYQFDPYPFILLNLLFSTQAAYASPLILMSQNRQANRDRARDDLEASEVQGLYENHQLLLKINEQQLAILELLKKSQEDKV